MAEATSGLHTVGSLLETTTAFFKKNSVESARLEAELLLARVLGVARIQLYVRFDQPLSPEEVNAFRELVKRRGRHEPVHYILGAREFWSLPLQVERGVLIPRPDTECLVEEALALIPALTTRLGRSAVRVGDVGTGSGAIALALAHELPEVHVFAGDIAEIPLRVATRNAAALGLGDRVTVVAGAGGTALAQAAGGPLDLLVSNPPYIREDELADLDPHVRDWEPREALVAGPDGLEVYRALVAELAATLTPGGALVFEIGATQGDAVQALLAPHFEELKLRKDYSGLPRVVVGLGFLGG